MTAPRSLVARDIFGPRMGLAERYVDLLTGRGVEFGLLGPREAGRVWDRHVFNSAALAAAVPAAASVVDVGSGAGLPGIPLAILRPDVRVTLLESLLRRVSFLEVAVEELDLGGQVRVVRGRAEEHREQFDVVASRAVAPLARLVGFCEPLRRDGGVMLALKGRSVAAEVAAARGALASRRLRAEVLTLAPHAEVEPATVVRVSSL